MNRQRSLYFVLSFLFALGFVTAVTPASASCKRMVLDGSGTFTTSNAGTTGDDLLICEILLSAGDTVWGYIGHDTILIYGAYGNNFDVFGDYTYTNGGNDLITVFSGGVVGIVAGDHVTNANIGGNDWISVYGSATRILGDATYSSTGTVDYGGNDVIDLYGTSVFGVLGDGLYNQDSYLDYGGDDVITVQKSGSTPQIYGDVYESKNADSRGGDDYITVHGKVTGNDNGLPHGIFGDWMRFAGTGGDDTIVISEEGQVGTNAKPASIYGDFVYAPNNYSSKGGEDDIQVEGSVWGSIYGDYVEDVGGSDYIIVHKSGYVDGNVYGDFLLKDSGTNGADNISILGIVLGNVKGDGNRGEGAIDRIVVEGQGYIGGSLSGDGTSKLTGAAKGGTDFITIMGQVNNNVYGDDVDGPGAKDTIILTTSSWVVGGVYGDNPTRSGGKGGNDYIVIDGTVGYTSTPTGVFGDKTGGDGGDDFLHVEKSGIVYGSVVGDDVNGLGGEDLIWIDGTVTKKVIGDNANGGNKKDQIAVRQGGLVKGSVIGDGTSNSKNGGWDVMNIIGGTVNQDFVGDDVGGNGGNDFMAIRMGGIVKRDFIGDDAGKVGGNDTMSLINGTVNGDMIGDDSGGNGGDDKMNVQGAGTVKGDLIGDKTGNDKVGGDDSIFVAGKVNGKIIGDHPSKNAFGGKDTIQTSPSAIIGKGIIGDNAKGAGKNDTFKINGKINANGVTGDGVLGKGGNDIISIFSLGQVTGNVIGDDANGAGGNDTILVDGGGKVTGNIWGDYAKGNGGNDKITIAGTVTGNVEGDHHKSNSAGNGGDDIIVVEEGGLVQGNVFGDNSPGAGGDDKIDIKGKVNGHVLGDNAALAGGKDIIRIFPTGVVVGSVCGRNFCNKNAGDNITYLDESATPSFDSADTIIIAGKVLGNVIAGTFYGSNSDDQIVVIEGAEIGGTVYAGDETEGDSFIYVENIINEEKTISEVVNSVTEKDGKVTVNGATYTLDNVENVVGAVGQIACFGMDYRMNKTSDGCAARSGAEKDAIQWHLDNPGNDGRLPGLEGCAVYPYGNALRIYEIMDGAQGELVAEIWGDVLSNAPAANELLGATADGRIALYHLASGELQIECRNLVDGKMQVRVLSDLAGTVVSAFDKS